MSTKRGYGWLWLATLAVLPYVTGIDHAFVYDDHGVLAENTFLENPANLLKVLTVQTMGDPSVIDGQRPVVVASYFADRYIWRLHPAGCRVLNLLLHAAATALLFMLFRRLTQEVWMSAAAALLFAWHPLMVEAVQSPAFREDLLYVTGGMIYLLVGARYQSSISHLFAGLTALAFALLSKEAAVIFPVLLAVIWWLFPEERPHRRWIAIWLIGSSVLTIVYVWAMASSRPVQSVGGVWNGISFQGSEGFWSAPWLAVWMLGKMLVPYPLSIDYVMVPVAGPWDLRFIVGMVLLGMAATVLYQRRIIQPVLCIAIAWMMLAYLPVSNVVPLFNPAADRYAYGIVPGFALLLVFGLSVLPRGGLPVFVVLISTYLVLTVMRLGDWRDDRSLWTAALAVEPSSSRAHTWLGLLEKKDGRTDAALAFFTAAEGLNPHDVSPTVNRAIILGERGDLEGAEQLLRDVLARRPDHELARRNLEMCLKMQEEKAGSLRELAPPD